MTSSKFIKSLLAGAAAVTLVGAAFAQSPPVNPAVKNPATGAGQQSTQGTPMGTTGTPGGSGTAGSMSGSTTAPMNSGSTMPSGSMSSGSSTNNSASTGSMSGSTSGRSMGSTSAGSGTDMGTTRTTRRARADRN